MVKAIRNSDLELVARDGVKLISVPGFGLVAPERLNAAHAAALLENNSPLVRKVGTEPEAEAEEAPSGKPPRKKKEKEE